MLTEQEAEDLAREAIADDIRMAIRKRRRVGKSFNHEDDVRLCVLLAEGKRACWAGQLSFTAWCKKNFRKLHPEQCKIYSRIGEDPNPDKALKDHKAKKVKISTKNRKKRKREEREAEATKERYDKLPVREKEKFLKEATADYLKFDDYDEEKDIIIENLTREQLNDDF